MNVSFFGELLQTISDRGRALLERARDRRGADSDALRKPDRTVEHLLSGRGEASGVALAREILGRYARTHHRPAHRVFRGAGRALRTGPGAHGEGDRRLARAAERRDRRRSARRLRAAPAGAVPPAQSCARRHRRAGAHARAVDRRAGASRRRPRRRSTTISCICSRPGSTAASWCLRRIDWSTPAIVLEKLIRYEAVHEIRGWDDLRRRIDPPDRRCYAFFHPALVDEPLIFVEVALEREIPGAIAPILASGRAAIRRAGQGAHRGVLFDLQLPARARRRVVRQFPDQAGGRGDLPRIAQAHDLRHAVAGAELCRWLTRELKAENSVASARRDRVTLELLERPHWWTDPETFGAAGGAADAGGGVVFPARQDCARPAGRPGGALPSRQRRAARAHQLARRHLGQGDRAGATG